MLEHTHPRYPRIVFVCGPTHPAVRPQADSRRPAYDALRCELRQHGFHASVHEEHGDMWIEELGEEIPYYEAKRLTEKGM
jgi:hypothetical protein